MKTRVLLADANQLFRYALGRLLDAEDDLAVVGGVAEAMQLVEAVKNVRPDVLIVDVTMPRMNGIDAIQPVRAASPGCRVLMLSASAEASIVGQALLAGASGFVSKTSSYGVLLDAIRTVVASRTYLEPGIADAVLQGMVRQNVAHRRAGDTSSEHGQREAGAGPLGPGSLTRRERQVLKLLTEGFATSEIAAALGVSIKTVATHRARMMRKLKIHNLAVLTKYAIREGITGMEE